MAGDGTAGTETTPAGAATPDPSATPAEKILSQAEVNAIVGKARQEERSKYSDYDETKRKLGELEKAGLTETERKDRELSESQRRASDAEGMIADTMIEAEIRVRAAQQGIVDPDASVALIDRSGLAYREEDGVTGVETALKTLVEAKPWLKGADTTITKPALDVGGKPAKAAAPLTAEEQEASRLMFPELPPSEAQAEYAKGKTP